jgi:phenylacetate-CoA ligase
MSNRERVSGFYQPELECLADGDRLEYQLKLARETARSAIESSPGAQERFREAGLEPDAIQDLKDLKALPLIRKIDFSAIQKKTPPFGGFTTKEISQLARVFVSPGPIYDPEGEEEDFWLLRKAFYAGGFRMGDVVQNTFSYHLTPAGMMCDRGLRDLGCVVVPTGVGNTEIQVNTMKDLGVTGYIGTPSYLMTIIRKAEEMGLNFRDDLSLEMAYVAAEILPPSLRADLQEGYGLHVRQGYITADLGCVAYECSEMDGLHVPEEILVEIIDPATGDPKESGEPGEVVVTTLKESYPLFRFATGDLSAEMPGACSCGRTSRRLTGVMGRADEVTKVRGMFVHPGMVNDVLERAEPGLKGQALVTRSGHQDELILRVVTEAEGEAFQQLAETLEKLAREIMKVRARVERITAEELGPWPKKIDDQRSWE